MEISPVHAIIRGGIISLRQSRRCARCVVVVPPTRHALHRRCASHSSVAAPCAFAQFFPSRTAFAGGAAERLPPQAAPSPAPEPRNTSASAARSCDGVMRTSARASEEGVEVAQQCGGVCGAVARRPPVHCTPSRQRRRHPPLASPRRPRNRYANAPYAFAPPPSCPLQRGIRCVHACLVRGLSALSVAAW